MLGTTCIIISDPGAGVAPDKDDLGSRACCSSVLARDHFGGGWALYNLSMLGVCTSECLHLATDGQGSEMRR